MMWCNPSTAYCPPFQRGIGHYYRIWGTPPQDQAPTTSLSTSVMLVDALDSLHQCWLNMTFKGAQFCSGWSQGWGTAIWSPCVPGFHWTQHHIIYHRSMLTFIFMKQTDDNFFFFLFYTFIGVKNLGHKPEKSQWKRSVILTKPVSLTLWDQMWRKSNIKIKINKKIG